MRGKFLKLKGCRYGRRLVCAGLYWGFACYTLLQVARAEFEETDHYNLQRLMQVANTINTGNNTFDISSGGDKLYDRVGDIRDDTSAILSLLQEDIYDDIRAINANTADILNDGFFFHYVVTNNQGVIIGELRRNADAFHAVTNLQKSTITEIQTIRDQLKDSGPMYHKLQDIEAGIDALSVNITNNVVVAISNAIAQIPRCNCVLTNFLTTSGNVDMGIVTNIFSLSSTELLFQLAGGLTEGVRSEGWWNAVDSLVAKLFYDTDEPIDRHDRETMYWEYFAQSPVGLAWFLIQSALGGYNTTGSGFYNSAYEYWSGLLGNGWMYSSLEVPISQYTIFDAYNTLNETNLPYISETLLAILNATTNNTASATAIATAIGYDGESTEIPLDYDSTNSLPEWEPTWHMAAGEGTNYYFYLEQAKQMSTRLFAPTNNINQLAQHIGQIQSSKFSHTLSFSGFPVGNVVMGGWQFDLKFPEGPAIDEFKRLVQQLWTIGWFFFDLCLIVYFARRIHRIVTHPFLGS